MTMNLESGLFFPRGGRWVLKMLSEGEQSKILVKKKKLGQTSQGNRIPSYIASQAPLIQYVHPFQKVHKIFPSASTKIK
jgi:hypothetical protein